MKDRLKKALLYGLWFLIFAPLMGFLFLAVFTVPMMIFFQDGVIGYPSLINLLQKLFGALLLGYVIFGLPAFFSGMVFGCCWRKPYSSMISGGVGALSSFISAFFATYLVNVFFGFSVFSVSFHENILIALIFAVLAFLFGSLLAFLFKEKLVATDGFKEPHKLIT